VLLGAAMQAATGFGFALVAVPLLVVAVGPREAVSALCVLGTVGNVLTLTAERRRPRPLLGEVALLTAWSLPGLAAGAVLLRAVPERAIELLVAVVVLVALALRLRAPRQGRPPSRARTAAAGLASGALSTSTGIGGPPLVFHLLARGLPPAVMRDTLVATFLAASAFAGAVLAAAGAFKLPGGMPLLIAVTAVGYFIGRRVFAALYGERYERVVLMVLALTALAALAAAVK
jgi:uncharacterized protein